MDEAYSVGIRLVLDDSVTPALAAMERQMAVLDQGMASRMAGVALVPSAKLPMGPVALPAEAAAPVVPAVPVPTPAAPAWPVMPPVQAPAAAVAPVVVTREAVREVRVPQAPERATAAPVPSVRTMDFMRFAPPRSAPVLRDAPRIMPSPPVLFEPAADRAAAPAAESAAVWPRAMAPLMQEAPRASVAPVAAAETRPAVERPEAGAAVPFDARATERAEDVGAQGGGPTGGDVFLDGMRVGRWMARELGRMADAPQSGSTFFDPRAGGTWPGTLQGEVAR